MYYAIKCLMNKIKTITSIALIDELHNVMLTMESNKNLLFSGIANKCYLLRDAGLPQDFFGKKK